MALSPFQSLRCKYILTSKEILSTSQVAQWVKNLPAMQEMQVQSLGQEDPLEEGIATHSRIHVWESAWTEVPGRLQSIGLQRIN